MLEENKGLVFGEDVAKSNKEPAEEGEYEFVLEKIEKKESKSGNDYLNFRFRIREDVPQKCQGIPVFYTISRKSGDECFNFYRINQLILTQKKDGEKLEVTFREFDEVLLYLQGIHFKGFVTVTESPDGKERNEISGDTFEPSGWDKTHAGAATILEVKDLGDGVKGNNVPDISDNDLPF